MWSLVFYTTVSGRLPVREYVDSLTASEAARVRFDLDLLKDFGLALGAPHVRCLTGKLWELRSAGRTHHRVLYFAASGKKLVLLHAFTKKTRKTPRVELDTALRRMADYLERDRT